MPAAKVTISVDEHVLQEIDRWVAAGEYPNRSRVMQAAIIVLKEQRDRRGTLLEELAKLDPAEERALADERLAAETTWPAFRGARSTGPTSNPCAATSRAATGPCW